MGSCSCDFPGQGALDSTQVTARGKQDVGDGPGASGSRPMPNGQSQEPDGWNRIVLKVADLPGFIDTLRKAVRFRNEMKTGPGGRQIQVEDPDGNPIELFEPPR